MFELTPFVRRNHVSTYNPFAEMDALERAFFGGERNIGFKTDIKEMKDSYLLEAELPGFDKKDISIEVDGDYLTVSAKHSAEKENKDESGYVHRERSYGSYSRSFDISSVKAESITAEYKNGVLVLNLPKKDENIPTSRRIDIM